MAHLHRIPFNFHGHGHALSGEFRHPLWSIIPAQASASLSSIGGIAVAHGENFHFQDFVCFKSAHTHNSGKIVALDEDRKVAICSLVEKIETRLKGVDAKRHLIEVKDFGKIFLAEVLAYPGTKTLTMLRLELGSPHVADLTVAQTGGNGQPSPP